MTLFASGIIHPDEPCWMLAEADEKGRRIRHYKVIRADRIVEMVEDIGEAGGKPFAIPGGVRTSRSYQIVHTVGELVDIADELRHSAAPTVKQHDIRQGYWDELLRRKWAKKGRKSWVT